MEMAKFRLPSGSESIEHIAIKLGIHNYIAGTTTYAIHVVLRQHGWYGQTRDLSHVMVLVDLFGRPFVKRFAVCYRTVVLSVLSCLSVTLVYCGQPVRWIKMKLGVQVGLGPDHIVLDGDPAPPPQKGAEAPIFGPFLL